MSDQQKAKPQESEAGDSPMVRGCCRRLGPRASNQKRIRCSEKAVGLLRLERFVVPGLEKLDDWLALSRPLIPALVAGQRHRVLAPGGRDGLRSAMVIATGWAGATEFSHRHEVNCTPPDEWDLYRLAQPRDDGNQIEMTGGPIL